ncbi:DUF4157 domain-containing protein [Lentzea sp. NPDC059081]|uniref:DUF4157 domain-containing protein n=1 Tax=Lentzea sp. NPDC059081 TaxID=3346719 RepID=UPI0036953EAD
MPWPFRRRAATPVVRAPESPQWRNLVPLRTTVSVRTPLVAVGLRRPPVVATTRNVLARPEFVHRDVPLARGRVRATPVERFAEPRWRPVPEPERRVVAAAPVEHPVLVRAADDYVGEPVAAREPHRAPGWMRTAPAPVVPEPEPVPRPAPAPRRNLGQSRRVGLGHPVLSHPVQDTPETEDEEPPPARPRYRTPGSSRTAPLPDVPEELDLPEPPKPSPVPADVVDHFRRELGTDVSGVPVHRGPEVSVRAAAMNARAFTTKGEVHLPQEAGSLESRGTKALLAHELTHVVQQRTRPVPHECTEEGRRLENQARRVERAFGGDVALVHRTPVVVPPPPPALPSPEDYADRVADVLVDRGLAHRDNGVLVLGRAPEAPDSVQRAEIDVGETTDDLSQLFADINAEHTTKVFHDSKQAGQLAKYLANHSDLVPLDWASYERESDLRWALDRFQDEYNRSGSGNYLTPDHVAALAKHLWRTKRETVFGDPSAADEDEEERERKERKIRSIGQLAREAGLGLAESWGGLLGMRFDRKTEREILRLPEEPEEDEEKPPTPGAPVPEKPKARADKADKPAKEQASRPSAPSPVPKTASPRKAAPAPAPRKTAQQEEEEDLERYQEERKIRSYPQLFREAGLGLAESWGGLAGIRFDRAVEREILRLPPEPPPEDDDEQEADEEVDGQQVRTGDERPRTDTGRPQIDPEDLDLDELVDKIYSRLRGRLRRELIVDRERAGVLADRY